MKLKNQNLNEDGTYSLKNENAEESVKKVENKIKKGRPKKEEK